MIAALLDNYRYQHEAEGFKLKKILWRRVMDVNDRGLRRIITGLGDKNGIETETGFDITPASEIMAIMCLPQVSMISAAASTISCLVLLRTTSLSK